MPNLTIETPAQITILDAVAATLNNRTEAERMMRHGKVTVNGIATPFNRPCLPKEVIRFGSFMVQDGRIYIKKRAPGPYSAPSPGLAG